MFKAFHKSIVGVLQRRKVYTIEHDGNTSRCLKNMCPLKASIKLNSKNQNEACYNTLLK